MSRKEKVSKKRQERAEIARETMAIVERGKYELDDTRQISISKEIEEAKASTILYDFSKLPKLPKARFESPCQIQVTNETTFTAVQRSSSDSNNVIGCLNFASAKNPGGGFLGGSQAQEEALSRGSALVPCLETQFEGYYQRNRDHKSPLYLDLAIVSPAVPFFRDDQGRLLSNFFPCTVITCPAPNAGVVLERDPDKDEQVYSTLVCRADMILHTAAIHRVDILILGAWGCGVFRNKPIRIAEIFGNLLRNKYERHFRRVVFAVFDTTKKAENYNAFSKILA